MLEVRHLRAFTEVARLGSFDAAARTLGYTQSGVSQQVQGLERIVGAPLLERPPGGRRPVELTDVGRLLLEVTPPARLEVHVFDVVNQLNRGPSPRREDERRRLAELNLLAGRRATTVTRWVVDRTLRKYGADRASLDSLAREAGGAGLAARRAVAE